MMWRRFTGRAVSCLRSAGKLLPLLSLLLLCSFNGRQPAGNDTNQPIRRNGFVIEDALIPAEQIIQLDDRRDTVAALKLPEAINAEELAERNFDNISAGHAAFLAAADRVVGVLINGQPRAYSVKMLARHQLVNDELAALPILVSYCPYTDGVVVFERRVEDRTAEFRVSGLLYNSNMLMYEDSAGQDSLWCQLQGRAISGPAAGLELPVLPCVVVEWQAWLAVHPDTEVSWSGGVLDYSLDPYESLYPDIARSYPPSPFDVPHDPFPLLWPVEPMLPADSELAPKEQIVAVDNGEGWLVFPLSVLREQLAHGSLLAVKGVVFTLQEPADDNPAQGIGSVFVSVQAGAEVQIAYAWWFAWYGMHPDSRIFPLPGI